MAKGSDSRRRTRRSAPKTIDLAASEVSEKKEAGTKASARPVSSESTVPPAEPVAFDGPNVLAAAEEAQAESAQPEEASVRKAQAPKQEAPKPRHDESGRSAGATEPPRRGAGFGALALAAVLGGLVALFLVGGLNQAGVLRDVPLLGGLASTQAAPHNGLAARTAVLEGKVAELEQADGNHNASQIDGLNEKLNQLSSRLGKAEEKLAQTGEAPVPTIDDSRLIDLSRHVDKLAGDVQSAQDEIAQLNARPAPEAAANAVDPEVVKDLQAKLGVADKKLQTVSDTVDQLSGKLAALETRVETDSKARAGLAQKQDAAITLAGNALRAAYRRGEPFADLLASLEALVGQKPAIDALKGDAAKGVATDAELKRQFSDLTSEILSAAQPKQEGIISKFIANARSLVEVRPAGPAEGNSPAAIVSRIEADLESGALTAAHDEWQSLPEPARQVSQAWAGRLESRIEADGKLRQVLADIGTPAQAER